MPRSTLFANGTFLRLFAAQTVSLAGSGITTIALALLVREFAGSTATAAILGQVLMLRIVAFLLFSQPAGLLADRLNRKWLLVGADLSRFVVMAAFPFIDSVWQIYVAVFIVNSLTAFFTPAYEASLPEIVGKDYTGALAYSRIAIDMEAILGPVLAGLLVAMMGLRWVFLVYDASYLVSAALVLSVSIPTKVTPPGQEVGSWKELSYGTRLLFREPSIRRALIMGMSEAIAGACAIVVTVVYVRDVLGRSTSAFAWTMAAVGIGSSLAAMLLSSLTSHWEQQHSDVDIHKIRHRWTRRALFAGGVAAIVSLIGGIFNPAIGIFAVLWLLNGASQAWIAIPSSTLVAEHTSPDDRGRAYGAHFAWTHVPWLVAYPLVGYLASQVGAGAAFTACGFACAIILGVAWIGGRQPEPNYSH